MIPEPTEAMPRVYAWTPGAGAYKHYPQYANFTIFADGRCVVKVRAPEFRTVDHDYYEMGETVCIQLPPEATAELREFFAAEAMEAAREPEAGKLREALEPFAENIGRQVPDDFPVTLVGITAGDVRRAYAALSQQERK